MAGWVRARLVSRGREPATRRKRDNYITAHVSPDSTCYHRLHRAARGALAIPGPLRFLQEAVRQRHLVLRSEGKTRGSVRQPSGPSGELGGGGGVPWAGQGSIQARVRAAAVAAAHLEDLLQGLALADAVQVALGVQHHLRDLRRVIERTVRGPRM